MTRATHGLAIVLLSIATCIAYGIVHDQITARICVEYFTIGHEPVFHTNNPTLLGLGWGVLATWWVGVMLGIPLALASLAGTWPVRHVRTLVRPMLILASAAAISAVLAGTCGYYAATHHWIELLRPLAASVPAEKHVGFLVDALAHTASYCVGFVGGFVLISTVVFSRWKLARRLTSRL